MLTRVQDYSLVYTCYTCLVSGASLVYDLSAFLLCYAKRVNPPHVLHVFFKSSSTSTGLASPADSLEAV